LATWLVERQYPGIIFQKEEGYWLVPLEISGHQGVLNVQVVTNKKELGRGENTDACAAKNSKNIMLRILKMTLL